MFEKWIKEYEKEMGKYPDNFAKDGIINEQVYKVTSPKLLFIAKETNRGSGDFRTWWQEEVKSQFSKRIFEWAYGILNDFPELNSIKQDQADRKKIMSKISFMNLKKTPGVSRASLKVIENTALKFKEVVIKEIEIICPDIIISGVGDDTLWGKMFRSVESKNTVFGRKLFQVGKMKIIDFYHPSCRIARAKSYEDLKNIFGRF